MPTQTAGHANQDASVGTASTVNEQVLAFVAREFGDPETAGTEEPQTEEQAVSEEPVVEGSEEQPDVEDAATEAEPAPEDPIYGVPVDGVEEQVPLSKLKQSYSGQQKIAKGLQEVATKERTAAEKIQQADMALAKYGERLDLLEQTIVANAPEEPNWAALQRENPDEYLRQRADYDARERKLQTVRAENDRVKQEQQRRAVEQQSARIAAEGKKLVEAVPEWKDETKYRAESDAVRSYLKGYGFSDGDFAAIEDHRAVVLARKAMLYDQLQTTTKPAVQAAVAKAPAMVKPGAAQPVKKPLSKVDAARRQLAKTGSPRDAEALMLAKLEAGEF